MNITKVQRSQGNTTWTIQIDGKIIGLIVKNTSSRTPQPWKAYKGHGDTATMIGFTFESMDAATMMVVQS